MRYRQTNKSDGGGAPRPVKSLLDSDDALSTREQEEVIRYFAKSMKFTSRFLIVIAGLHVLLAAVYVVLMFSGSPLVSTFNDGNTKQAFDDTRENYKRIQAHLEAMEKGRGGIFGSDQDAVGEATGAAAAKGSRMRRQQASGDDATDKWPQREDLARGRGLTGHEENEATPLPPLSVGSSLAMLTSAVLLCLGGYGCRQAYVAMRLDANELVSQAPRDAASHRHRNNHGVSAEADPVGSLPPCRDESDRKYKATSAVASATFHYKLALIALGSTLYWLVAMLRTKRTMHALYREMGASFEGFSNGAASGLADNVLEVVLIVWEPAFHVCIGLVLASMYDSRAQLVALSQLKYCYERI